MLLSMTVGAPENVPGDGNRSGRRSGQVTCEQRSSDALRVSTAQLDRGVPKPRSVDVLRAAGRCLHTETAGTAGIGDAEAHAQHRFSVQLISDPQSRPKGQVVVLRKIAPAVPGTVAFKDRSAGVATGDGVSQSRREIRSAAVLLAGVAEVIPSQAIVQRELARDFPGVLGKEVQEFSPCSRFGGSRKS